MACSPPATTAPARAVPRPPPRDLRMDIMRGWMQISIFVSHIFGTAFAWGIHAAWGISDSSEQFVFLSGLALGSVFALKSARDGFGAARGDLARRTWHLYRTHLLVLALFAALVLAAEMWLPLPGEVARRGWSLLVESPLQAVAGAGLMLWQPEFMGILPVFVWCMLLLPPFMWLVERIGTWALLPPLALYVATQFGLVATPGIGPNGIAFDPLAWQMIFLLGAWLGRRALLCGQAAPRRGWLVAAASAMVLFGLWVRLVDHGALPGPEHIVTVMWGKEVLAPARLLHALALAYLVAALLPREAPWMRGVLGTAMATIGRHSLQVFCVGLFLAWGASLALERWPAEALWLDPLLVFGGSAVLLGVASLLDQRRSRMRTARAPA